MLKINTSNWKWIVFFLVAVLTYFFLDIVDAAVMLRQWLLFPICFFMYLLHCVFGHTAMPPLIEKLGDLLDVDHAAKSGAFIRVCAFGIVLGSIVVPIYLYRRRKKKIYLVLLLIAIAWIIVSLCFWFFIFLSMIGMMD